MFPVFVDGRGKVYSLKDAERRLRITPSVPNGPNDLLIFREFPTLTGFIKISVNFMKSIEGSQFCVDCIANR